MPREPLTLVGTSRTIRSVQSGIWAMEMRKNPAEFCGGLARQQARLLASFPIASLLLSPRAKTTRAFCGVFAFGRPDAVRRWSGLGYPAARASQSGERGLSPERGGERESGRRESDGWLHTEVQVASGANCVEARLGSALLRDSPPEVRSKEYVSLWRNAQYRGVDIGKMEISVSLLRKVRGVSV
jgi:hypothetical protein